MPEGILTAASILATAAVVWLAIQLRRARTERAALSQRVARLDEAAAARETAEAALRDSEEFNRRILESSGDCIKVMGLDARLEAMSDGGMCVMEVDDFELVRGTPWPELWSPDLRTMVHHALDTARAGSIGRFQGPCATAKGSPKWWDVVVSPIRGADNAVAKLLAISRDITELKQAATALAELNATLEQRVAEAVTQREQAEAQLRQSQKMEAVGRLTGGVAHDFNNLLTVITGNLDLLKRGLGEDPRTRRLIGNALEGTRRAGDLTHRLLAFSRQSPLRPERLDANRLAAGMSDLLRRTLGEDIAIETVQSGGLWPALADTNQLENAILNLAVNARDAMPGGGKLTIETANCHLDEGYRAVGAGEVVPGQYVMIAVSDTGSGMPPEVLDNAFEPFFTTKPIGNGTGLGLAQVYGFCKQSGGHATIYSEPGHGTTVKLYLPRALRAGIEAVAPAKTATATPPPARPGETILVVEDEDIVRSFTVTALEDAGYRILAAAHGPAALAFLRNAGERIDLLLSDVILSGPMTGRQVATAAQNLRPGLPVLFTTGYTRNATIHHGQLDEDVLLISKPFTASDLAFRVRQTLGEQRAAA